MHTNVTTFGEVQLADVCTSCLSYLLSQQAGRFSGKLYPVNAQLLCM